MGASREQVMEQPGQLLLDRPEAFKRCLFFEGAIHARTSP
jgi:hypothetical protein